MAKKISASIVYDEQNFPFAVNRKARRMLRAKKIPHIAVPMSPLKTIFGKLTMHAEDFIPAYAGKGSK